MEICPGYDAMVFDTCPAQVSDIREGSWSLFVTFSIVMDGALDGSEQTPVPSQLLSANQGHLLGPRWAGTIAAEVHGNCLVCIQS